MKIYEFTPGFVHAKVFASDDEKAVVGTINLDYRSLYLHFECAVDALSESRRWPSVEADFQETLAKCQEVHCRYKRNMAAGSRNFWTAWREETLRLAGASDVKLSLLFDQKAGGCVRMSALIRTSASRICSFRDEPWGKICLIKQY